MPKLREDQARHGRNSSPDDIGKDRYGPEPIRSDRLFRRQFPNHTAGRVDPDFTPESFAAAPGPELAVIAAAAGAALAALIIENKHHQQSVSPH